MLFAFLNRIGILPIIKPIKQKLVGIGYVANKNFNNLLTSNTPIIPPSAIGNRKAKFFLKSLNSNNYVISLNLDDLKVKYKLIIEFSDKSNDKYVINIFDKNTVTLFPWDGNLQEDMINMDNIPARDNLYSFCIYIINKDNSSN